MNTFYNVHGWMSNVFFIFIVLNKDPTIFIFILCKKTETIPDLQFTG